MNNKTLLNVFDAYFYIKDKLVFMSENLTNSSIKGEATENEIKNGIGNATWATISSSKTLEVELQTNVFDFPLLATLSGTSIATGSGTAYCAPIVATVTSTEKTITLKETPLDSTKIEIYDLTTDKLVTSSDYTILEKVVTFTSKTGEFKVMPYEYTITGELETITISADKFSEAGKLILKTIEVDKNNKPIADVEVVIERAKPASSFTLNSQSELSGSDNTITLKALKDNSGNLGVIKRMPIVSV